MLNVSPLIPLILGLFLAIVVVRDSITRKVFLKYRMTISFVIIFVFALLSLFYESLTSTENNLLVFNYAMLFSTVLIAILILFNGLYNIANNELNNKILTAFDNTIYYLYINKKGKILAISNELKETFNIDKDVIYINDILNNYITIKSINNEDVSNADFVYYLSQKNQTSINNKLDIRYYLNDGTIKEICLIEQILYKDKRYIGRIFVGQNSKNNILPQEVEDEVVTNRLEALLNTKLSGLMLHDLNNDNLWVNDYLIDKLNLERNNMAYSDYKRLIDKDDYNAFVNYLNELESNEYEFIYRISNGKKKVYVKEVGKYILDGHKKVEALSYVLINDNRNFMKTNTILDNLEEENELLVKIDDLGNHNINYELVVFELENIVNINEQYNRQIGTLVLEEYVKTFTKVFADSIYRISGLVFVMIITDIRKMELFKKTLLNGKIFNPTLTYGSVNCDLIVKLGISFSNDAIRPREVYANAKVALKKAKERNIPYLFFKDMNK